MRLFAALPLPAVAAERLTRLRLRLSTPADGLRWSSPEQWHITLQFYGEVDPACASCLRQELAGMAAALPTLSVAVDELGLFAAKGILYAAVTVSPGLQDLYQQVIAASARCGISAEPRPFRPHITLARSKGKAGHKTLGQLSRPALPSLGAPLHWDAPELHLIQSILQPHGSVYLINANLPFGATRAPRSPADAQPYAATPAPAAPVALEGN